MKKQNKSIREYSRLMYIGLFLIFPVLFFGNQLRETIWFDVFGVLALMGFIVSLYSFVKILKKKE